MGNSIILVGILLIIAGLLLNVMTKGQIPLLPGDLLIKKENMTVYFPVVTSIVISIIVSLIFYFFRK